MFTKEFRHELYKKTLEAYLNPDLYQFGLCNAIEQAHHFLKYGRFVILGEEWERRTWPLLCDNEEIYPEIFKHEPKNHGVYWFPIAHTKSRVFILMQAIEETKP